MNSLPIPIYNASRITNDVTKQQPEGVTDPPDFELLEKDDQGNSSADSSERIFYITLPTPHKLPSGSFWWVSPGISSKGNLVAIKKPKRPLDETSAERFQHLSNIHKEIYPQASHQLVAIHITEPAAPSQQSKPLSSTTFYQVEEFFGCGDLFEIRCSIQFILNQENVQKNQSNQCCRLLFKKAVLSLWSIHKKGYAHFDIKPENLICRFTGSSEEIDLQITDLDALCANLSKKTQQGNIATTACYCPTKLYLARETEKNQANDIWSLAITLISLFKDHPLLYFMKKSQEKKPLESHDFCSHYLKYFQTWRNRHQLSNILTNTQSPPPSKRHFFFNLFPTFNNRDEDCIHFVNLFKALNEQDKDCAHYLWQMIDKDPDKRPTSQTLVEMVTQDAWLSEEQEQQAHRIFSENLSKTLKVYDSYIKALQEEQKRLTSQPKVLAAA